MHGTYFSHFLALRLVLTVVTNPCYQPIPNFKLHKTRTVTVGSIKQGLDRLCYFTRCQTETTKNISLQIWFQSLEWPKHLSFLPWVQWAAACVAHSGIDKSLESWCFCYHTGFNITFSNPGPAHHLSPSSAWLFPRMAYLQETHLLFGQSKQTSIVTTQQANANSLFVPGNLINLPPLAF